MKRSFAYAFFVLVAGLSMVSIGSAQDRTQGRSMVTRLSLTNIPQEPSRFCIAASQA